MLVILGIGLAIGLRTSGGKGGVGGCIFDKGVTVF